jgi:hypothetical protein
LELVWVCCGWRTPPTAQIAVTVWQIPDAVDTVVLWSWWWVEVPPETCRAVSR